MMKARVLFFSQLRDLCGFDEVEIELAEIVERKAKDGGDGPLVADLLHHLYGSHPALKDWDGRILVAVDQEYAERDTVLRGGEEIAIMPPVQGG